MRKIVAIGIALLMALMGVIVLTPTATASGSPTEYGDVTLSGGFQTGHFDDIWDLTAGDIELSFTYDANGLVDDFGGDAHAWGELGVRSVEYYSKTVDLIADQEINIGNVLVEREGDYLHVTYSITEEGWVILKTHLAIADSLDGIPQTKSGNPKIGLFPYKMIHDPPVIEYTYPPIDVSGYSPGTDIYIAAHALVVRPIDGCYDNIWQIGDVEEDPLDNPCDEFNYPTIVYGTQDFFVDTTPTSDYPWISRADKNYAPVINIHFNAGMLFGGKLYLSWSPGASGTETMTVAFDGVNLGTIIRNGAPNPLYWGNYERYIDSFDVPSVGEGDHVVTITFTTGDGSVWDWVKLDKPCEQQETAWGDGEDFPGKNWATYFIYSSEIIANDFNPTWLVEGSGVWLATDYDWAANTFDPDPPESPTQDMDDKLILQKGGGQGEGDYNLPSTPPNPGANHAVWFDRDGVDQWQAQMWGAIDGVTYNTEGTYEVVISLHATSDTTGEAYLTINGEPQGFYDPGWHSGPADLMPAGMTFSGDMEHLQVFYGMYGYGATHTIIFEDITVTQS